MSQPRPETHSKPRYHHTPADVFRQVMRDGGPVRLGHMASGAERVPAVISAPSSRPEYQGCQRTYLPGRHLRRRRAALGGAGERVTVVRDGEPVRIRLGVHWVLRRPGISKYRDCHGRGLAD